MKIVDRGSLGYVFLRILQFLPVTVISTGAALVFIDVLQRTNGRSVVSLPKSNALSRIGQHLTEKYYHLVFNMRHFT
jgi:branched-subunit amino acid transport protein